MDRKVGVFVLKIPVPFTYGGVENNLLSRDTAAPCHRGSGVASKVGSIGMRLLSESTREVEAPCCRAATVAAVLLPEAQATWNGFVHPMTRGHE